MSSIINSLKKDESIFDKQLLIINSDNKNQNESETSFTNTFTNTDRITKIEILDCDIPNTLYNVNNDNSIMDVDVSLLNGNVENKKLIVDDEEINNNVIIDTNIANGSIVNHNYISSLYVKLNDIKTQDLNIFVLGEFRNEIVSFYNSDNVLPVSTIYDTSGESNIFLACYNTDQTFKWRLKIIGNMFNSKIYTTEEKIYVYGKSYTDLNIYNINDNPIYQKTAPGFSFSFIIEYDLLGNYLLSYVIADYTISEIFLEVSEGYTFIHSTFNNSISYYDLNNVEQGFDSMAGINIYMCVYDDGVFITSKKIITTNATIALNSMKIQGLDLFLSFEHTGIIFFDIIDEDPKLEGNGICVANYTFDLISLNYNGRIKISGTSVQNNSRLASNSDYLFIIGNFNSNPVTFYNPDDTANESLSNVLYDNKNIFIARYPIDFIKNNLPLDYVFYITSTDTLQPSFIISGINYFYISCNFKNDIKFYDKNGYVATQDISNFTTNDISQCIISYKVDGNYNERIYNKNSSISNMIDINNVRLYTIGSFTTDNLYYNTKNTLDLTLSAKEYVNGIITSYTNSNTGYSLNYDKIDKTLVCKDLALDEFGYVLNINAFSETLGFTVSQKFIASNFGNVISWQTIDINNTNNKITFDFLIANLQTQKFDKKTLTLTIPSNKFATYNPYNLVYELNTLFKTAQSKNSFLTQNTNAFFYNNIKNIFYVRFDINGSFYITDLPLSNTVMNLQLYPYKSPLCVISDNVVGNVDNEIVDNTKLTLKLRNQIESDVVNNVSFNEAFPLVVSNTLNIKSDIEGSANNIYAQVGSLDDSLSNINIGDRIEFRTPFIPNEFYTDNIWQSTAMSSNGQYKILTFNKGIYISSDFGNIWKKSTIRFETFNSRSAISSNGEHITIVYENGQIIVSNDYGSTWKLRDNKRKWASIAMSSNGEIQTAVVDNGLIYVSHNYGEIWSYAKSADQFKTLYKNWKSITMSSDGRIQTAVVYGGKIWNSTDYGLSWNEIIVPNSLWISVAMSSNSIKQTALVEGGGNIWQSADSGLTWFTGPGPIEDWKSISMSSDGDRQTAVSYEGYVFMSNDYGNSWVQRNDAGDWNNRPWKFVSMSSNGDIQLAVLSGGNIWNYSNTGDIWTEQIVNNTPGGKQWLMIAMSSNGSIQTAVNFNEIWNSNDYGTTWTENATSINFGTMFVAMSSDGTKQTLAVYGGRIWNSNDSGVTWVENNTTSNRDWSSIAMSSDGSIQTAVINNGKIWTSNDYGNTWTLNNTTSTLEWVFISMSDDGSIQTAVVTNGKIWNSNDYGSTWTENSTTDDLRWKSVAMSSNGSIQTAVNYINGSIWNSNDYGNTWTKNPDTETQNKDWVSISMSSDGSVQTAVTYYGIWISKDSGNTWLRDPALNTNGSNWTHIAMSSNGSIQSVVSDSGNIYTNLYTTEYISFNVKYKTNYSNNYNRIIFDETPTSLNNYALLNNYNMYYGYDYIIKSYTNAPVENVFITPGNYTIPEFISQVNSQLFAINDTFKYNSSTDVFTYNSITKKITFNPPFQGSENDILIITNLLKSMGFIELPQNIIEPFTAQNVVNRNLSGSNNLYIRSDTIGKYVKDQTLSTNLGNKSIIATLKYDPNDDSYRITDSNKNEIYLSQKISLNEIDIKIVNDKSEIVNLNGGRVVINIKLIKS